MTFKSKSTDHFKGEPFEILALRHEIPRDPFVNFACYSNDDLKMCVV